MLSPDGTLWSPIGGDTKWPARERLTATCRRWSFGPLEVPHAQAYPFRFCRCGIYIGKDIGRMHHSIYQFLYPDVRVALGPLVERAMRYKVFGICAGWGETVEHTYGWRCRYAYPQLLALPLTHVGSLRWGGYRQALALAGERYGIPVAAVTRGWMGSEMQRVEKDTAGDDGFLMVDLRRAIDDLLVEYLRKEYSVIDPSPSGVARDETT